MTTSDRRTRREQARVRRIALGEPRFTRRTVMTVGAVSLVVVLALGGFVLLRPTSSADAASQSPSADSEVPATTPAPPESAPVETAAPVDPATPAPEAPVPAATVPIVVGGAQQSAPSLPVAGTIRDVTAGLQAGVGGATDPLAVLVPAAAGKAVLDPLFAELGRALAAAPELADALAPAVAEVFAAAGALDAALAPGGIPDVAAVERAITDLALAAADLAAQLGT